MEKEIEEILRKHNLKGILPMQRCKQELLNLFSVSKKLCNCKTPRPQMKVSENGISGYCANCINPL